MSNTIGQVHSDKKPQSLGELTAKQQALSAELAKYSDARSFLLKVARGEADLPSITVGENVAKFDMGLLPKDACDVILSVLIDNAERNIICIWQNLQDVSSSACATIAQIQQAAKEQMELNQPEQMQEVQEENPPVLKLPTVKNSRGK